MNRHERRAARAVAESTNDREAFVRLAGSVVETLHRSMPGCDVVLVVARGDGARVDLVEASTLAGDPARKRAILAGYVETLDRASGRTQ